MSAFRLLAIRPDRLGDFVLTTPAFQALGDHFDLTLCAQAAFRVLVPPAQKFCALEDLEKNSLDYDGVIVFRNQFKLLWTLLRHNIPKRIGSLTQWYSYPLLTHGLRQNRSSSWKHEYEYSLDLARFGAKICGATINGDFKPQIFVDEKEQKILKMIYPEPFILIHIGSRFSAENLSIDQYLDLARSLKKKVIFSFGAYDEAYYQKIKILGFTCHMAESLAQLVALISLASVLVSSSTGPMHVASALGVPVFVFFTRIRSQSFHRWGPMHTTKEVIAPRVHCGELTQCVKNSCVHYPCLQRLDLTEAKSMLQEWENLYVT